MGIVPVHEIAIWNSACTRIFHRIMENILQDISGVAVYLDDIIITGQLMAHAFSHWNEYLIVLQWQDYG